MAPDSFDRDYLEHEYEAFTDLAGAYAWDLPRVRDARDAQQLARFETATQLASSIFTDAACYCAVLNRLAPGRGLPREIFGGKSTAAQGEATATFIDGDIAAAPDVLADAHEEVAIHAISVAQNIWTPREDGSRVDVRLEPWPLERVAYQTHRRQLVARTKEGLVDINHGDGKWVVFQNHRRNPWKRGALVALAMLWADRQYAVRDRSQNSEAHGQAKYIGELPPGITPESAHGKAFIALLKRLPLSRAGGIRPPGSKVELIESMSQNWQIFREIINSDASDAAKVLLGQDATTGQPSGKPGTSDRLFGVRNDIVEMDLSTLARGLNTGTIRVWEIVNFGRAGVAGRMRWMMPDPDEDARRESYASRMKAFNENLEGLRKNDFVVDQEFCDALAKVYGIAAPKLASVPKGRDFYAYEIELGCVSPNEVRERAGLPPREGGNVTIPEQRQAEAAAQREAEAKREEQRAAAAAQEESQDSDGDDKPEE